MNSTCPACGHPASGRFCSHCGASLEAPVKCAECGNQLPPGGRFCNMCGTSALAAASPLNQQEAEPRAASNLPWFITGAALVALIVVLLVPRFRNPEPAPAGVAAGPPITGTTGDPRAVDLSSMSPREAADRLFNRVMQNVSSGDSAQARQFLPMALAAYGRVEDLDLDGRYHLAVLHLVDRDAQSARAQADSILAVEPSHLFGLFTAAQAEQEMGNSAAARALFRRFLDRFDAEVARGLPEYGEHEPVLPAMKQEAERVARGA